MSAAGSLSFPTTPSATSPKDLSVPAPGPIPGLAGRAPGLPDLSGGAGGHPFLPAQFAAMAGMADPRLLYSALVSIIFNIENIIL